MMPNDISDDFKMGAKNFLTLFVLFNTFVPISLYVTIEFIKLLQVLTLFFIYLSLCLFISLSLYLFISLSLYLFISLSLYLFISLSIRNDDHAAVVLFGQRPGPIRRGDRPAGHRQDHLSPRRPRSGMRCPEPTAIAPRC
jgi:hypothetical protein